MALVRNTLHHVIDIAPYGTLGALDTDNLDLDNPYNQRLYDDGVIVLIDAEIPPPAPLATFVPVRARVPYVADPPTFIVDVSDATVGQVIGVNGLPVTVPADAALVLVRSTDLADQGRALDAYTGLPFDVASAGQIASKADLVGGLVPSSQIPAVALTDVSVVTSEAEQVALVAQSGDIAVRSDLPASYVHNFGTAGTIADWTLLDSPTAVVQSVNGQVGTVVLGFADVGAAAASHTHPQSDVTGLVSALAGKAASVHTHAESDVTGLVADLAAKATNAYVDGQDALIASTVPVSANITADRTLGLADAGRFGLVNSAGSVTLTIPPQNAVAWPAGTVLPLGRGGAGTVTVTGGAGVTVQSEGGKVTIGAQYQSINAHRMASDVWWLYGALK